MEEPLFGVGAVMLARIPNQEALALSPVIGWLTLVGCLCLLAVIIADRERWAKLWLRSEDPRTMGAMRIVLAGLTIFNVNGLFECVEFLFSDEGIFTTETARQVLARHQFAGYGDGYGGSKAGFFDFAAVLTFLRGPKYSLLFFSSEPWFVWAHVLAVNLALISYMLGWHSRISGWLSFGLVVSLFTRNPLFLTGADVVFRCLLFYLALAKTGHAYSIDNWLRCRALRRRGKLEIELEDALQSPSDEAEKRAAATRAPIYRRIPAWPRMLMILQIATIYLWTGSAKTGNVWLKGDSLYYALSLDHFYRVPTQLVGSVFGTNLFRLMSWVVHTWQIGFPLLIVALIVRWARDNGLPGPMGARRWVWRAGWVGLATVALAIFVTALPVHYAPSHSGQPSVAALAWIVGGLWLLVCVLVAWLWSRGDERQFSWTWRTHTISLRWRQLVSLAFSRRLWLGLGVVFHLKILMLMNIGMFAPVMIASYLAFINGHELASMLAHLRRIGWRVLGRKDRAVRVASVRACEAPEDVAHAGVRPRPSSWPVVAACAAILGAFMLAVALPREADSYTPWLLGFALLMWLCPWRWPRTRPVDTVSGVRPWPWAYGELGRRVVSAIIGLHIVAVAAWSIPDKDCTRSFRSPVRKVVEPWLGLTQTKQSWNMFAPNPPRSNTFLMAHVTDEKGEVWDLRVDANSPRHKVHPWFWYSRWGKITRRIAGSGEWYRKWYGRYLCRAWALEHDGALPVKVDLIKQWYTIPSPERARAQGPHDAGERLRQAGHRRYIHHTNCRREVDVQLSNEVRMRHGLDVVDDASIRLWHKHRAKAWARRQE